MTDEDFLLISKKTNGGDEGEAFLSLAAMYYRGTGSIPKDHNKALHYSEKAGVLGKSDGAYNAATMYDENGKDALALIWYEKAAQLGEDKAMYNLGLMYAEGQGVPQDYKKAMEWYKKAGHLGNAKAIYNIGGLAQSGRGMPVSYETALELYEISGAAGHSHGAYNAGALYEQIFKDNKNAFLWYEKAANLGLTEGMFEIGRMYHQGVGIVADNTAAELWLVKAFELGNSSAKSYLEQYSGSN